MPTPHTKPLPPYSSLISTHLVISKLQPFLSNKALFRMIPAFSRPKYMLISEFIVVDSRGALKSPGPDCTGRQTEAAPPLTTMMRLRTASGEWRNGRERTKRENGEYELNSGSSSTGNEK